MKGKIWKARGARDYGWTVGWTYAGGYAMAGILFLLATRLKKNGFAQA